MNGNSETTNRQELIIIQTIQIDNINANTEITNI